MGDCPSNHPGVNINHVERQLDLRRAEGAVIVRSDCNADPTTKRFKALEQQWVMPNSRDRLPPVTVMERWERSKEVPMLTASEWEQKRFNVADALEKAVVDGPDAH